MDDDLVRGELICEDAAHEATARALVERCARVQGLSLALTTRSARLGVPRLRSELRALDRVRDAAGAPAPDLLVVLMDANRRGVAARRREIGRTIDLTRFPASVVGVPDPYVERWLMAHPASFARLFGREPVVPRARDRARWKRALVDSLEAAGEIVTQGGAEFAPEIVDAMDLYQAGRAVASLGAFVDDLVGSLRRFDRGVDVSGRA